MGHVEASELEPLEEYRARLLARIDPLEPIALGLLEAHGCVLAEDVVAAEDVPAFANSSMDGFAVRAADGTATRRLVGEVAAGEVPDRGLGVGQAMRIMTGAMLPDGADCVVPLELAEARRGEVTVREVGEPGRYVRRPGESARAGEVVLSAGRFLGPAEVGLAAAVGRARVVVHPRPRVVVVSTGHELIEPDAPSRPGAVRDANSYGLIAAAREAGATTFRLPIVPDDRSALRGAFEGALVHADVLVTSGGVSAGVYDLVKGVLGELGDVRFAKVGMQPGMPQAFGVLDHDGTGVPCFGLPGNPVSALVSFEVFVRPALRRMQGRADLNRPRVRASAAEEFQSPAHKVSFLRVRLARDDAGAWSARTTGAQGSGILTSMAEADGLAEIPAERTRVAPGEEVIVHLLGEP